MEQRPTWQQIVTWIEREGRRARRYRGDPPPLVTVVVVDASDVHHKLALRPDSVAAMSIDGQPPSLVVVDDEQGRPRVVELCGKA